MRRAIGVLPAAIAMAIAAACVVASTADAAQLRYTVTDLGAIGAPAGLVPLALDGHGRVAGYVAPAGAAGPRSAALYAGGAVTRLAVPGASSAATAIDDAGRVGGEWQRDAVAAGDLTTRGFVVEGGVARSLGPLLGSERSDVAALGAGGVAGNLDAHAYLVAADGRAVDLGTLGGRFSVAHDVNAAGRVVGASTVAAGSLAATHAFLWDGAMHDLGTLPGDAAASSTAYAINATGVVVGESGSLPFEYLAGVLRALPLPGGARFGSARDVNAAGDVVGLAWSSATGAPTRAFVVRGGIASYLDASLAPGSGWSLATAVAINDAGQIVGTGTLGGAPHGYLLTPESGVASAQVTVRHGTSRSETLIGTSRADVIYGGGGDDRILGGAGADRLYGGAGDDTITGGPGADVIVCGPGRDTAFADRSDHVDRSCELVVRKL